MRAARASWDRVVTSAFRMWGRREGKGAQESLRPFAYGQFVVCLPKSGREKKIGADNKNAGPTGGGVSLISLLAAFCGGLAWALDHELFAVAFAAAAVTGAFGVVATLMGTGGS